MGQYKWDWKRKLICNISGVHYQFPDMFYDQQSEMVIEIVFLVLVIKLSLVIIKMNIQKTKKYIYYRHSINTINIVAAWL